MDELIEFLNNRLDEEEQRVAQGHRQSSSGEWIGIDPAEVAEGLNSSTVTPGRRAIELYRAGKLDEQHLKRWAFSFKNHPEYRQEWRPR